MHSNEAKSTTNTGRIACAALPNSEIRIRGRKDLPFMSEGMVTPERQSLFLYPSDDSIELTAEYVALIKQPITLIVPDGTWRQASKVARREPTLALVPRVRLPAGAPSAYQLRLKPQPHCLSTIEAIARAFGVLESLQVQRALEQVLVAMVERTLYSRGKIAAADYDGPRLWRAGGAPPDLTPLTS